MLRYGLLGGIMLAFLPFDLNRVLVECFEIVPGTPEVMFLVPCRIEEGEIKQRLDFIEGIRPDNVEFIFRLQHGEKVTTIWIKCDFLPQTRSRQEAFEEPSDFWHIPAYFRKKWREFQS